MAADDVWIEIMELCGSDDLVSKKKKRSNDWKLFYEYAIAVCDICSRFSGHPSSGRGNIPVWTEQTGDGIPRVTMLQRFNASRLVVITFGHA